MKHLTDADRTLLADRLQAMKRSALDEIRGASSDVEATLQPQGHEVKSHADEAEVERLGDVRFAEIEIDRARLLDIEQAEQRMAAGGYGVCMDCGDAIPRERLMAQPTAIRCAACQTAAENKLSP
ncbi:MULTISPECIES: TraR/DksA family transcriptional regulator [unclassified Variovorax]|uniref:TraR/DksA family transcriptional regulator n=1 Tax=unclassified Variovorax TaxID=663243 RepID=UPI00076CA184|nr:MULTISPECIES: TraR/DksA family transcriptional regulator [unclassified Variovorax]KWT94099.1 DnaK suppressor protein [Variovorax sp. WDL1]PNG59941.1 General stress protein 16O [Variovorax sp. B4]PNG60267.1 General stress protein 16O [Variovorax sp. B2]VTV13894.1 General stress protein 16O [Variovorax sp. WDL1]